MIVIGGWGGGFRRVRVHSESRTSRPLGLLGRHGYRFAGSPLLNPAGHMPPPLLPLIITKNQKARPVSKCVPSQGGARPSARGLTDVLVESNVDRHSHARRHQDKSHEADTQPGIKVQSHHPLSLCDCPRNHPPAGISGTRPELPMSRPCFTIITSNNKSRSKITSFTGPSWGTSCPGPIFLNRISCLLGGAVDDL